MTTTTLTKEWQPRGDIYEKECQDIRLKDGREIYNCWLNAGKFICMHKGYYDGKEFNYQDVSEIRLTHYSNW